MRTPCLLFVFSLVATTTCAQSTCRIKPYGDSCGPVLSGSHQAAQGAEEFLFGVTDGIPSAMGILILGYDKIGLPISVYGCKLLTVPLATFAFGTDPTGAGDVTVTASVPVIGRFFAQSATFSATTLTASNGLELECR